MKNIILAILFFLLLPVATTAAPRLDCAFQVRDGITVPGSLEEALVDRTRATVLGDVSATEALTRPEFINELGTEAFRETVGGVKKLLEKAPVVKIDVEITSLQQKGDAAVIEFNCRFEVPPKPEIRFKAAEIWLRDADGQWLFRGYKTLADIQAF